MYTLIIMALCVISIGFIGFNARLYCTRAFLFWLVISCIVGWTEFICFLRFDAWVFAHQHIIGWWIAGVAIEDILFCPCFSIIFYQLYDWTKGKFKQRKYNPTDKLIFAIVVFAVALLYYDLGSQFSKYMAVRTCIGFVGMLYCWNTVSFRHCALFLIVVYLIGFGWDLPSVRGGVWVYIQDDKIPLIYDGLYFSILSAKFPVELFGYYFTGGFFSFWIISFVRQYFKDTHPIISKLS